MCNTDGNVKIIDEINSSLTDQELTLILLINRLIKGNSYLCKKIYSTLLNQSKDLPCYFYSPKVDGMIDEFFVANKVKRQSLCIKRDPVVESERSWFESHYFSGALMQSVFIEVTDYYENIYKPIDRAKFRADEYYNSIFRMQIPDNFDVVAYLLINTDILFEGIDPYKHYLEYGREEGREFNFGQ